MRDSERENYPQAICPSPTFEAEVQLNKNFKTFKFSAKKSNLDEPGHRAETVFFQNL